MVNTSCLGCPDLTACNGPSSGDGNPQATTCSWDEGVEVPGNPDVSCCQWLDCAGDCTCNNSNGTGGTNCTQVDLCGQCGGTGDCEGCNNIDALNYDIRLLDPTFTEGTSNESCVFGDIVITPQSSDGHSTDSYLIN